MLVLYDIKSIGWETIKKNLHGCAVAYIQTNN